MALSANSTKKKLQKKIKRILINNSSRGMEETCVELAKRYDWDKIVDEIEEVYRKWRG